MAETETEEELPEESESRSSAGFTERVRFVGHIHRQLNFSVFGLSLLAIPVGILSAYGAWGFLLAFNSLGSWLRDFYWIEPQYFQWLALIGGGLIFGLLLQILKWQRFTGPAHVIVAASENGGKLRLRDGLISSFADALSLALAAPVGRYGPAVQLGATIGSVCAQALRLGETSIRILLGCGVAAAISAAFNAPIAGVIFAHEVILGHFKLKAFAPITLASVSSVAIARAHSFEYVALKLWSAPHEITLGHYPVYLGFGLLAALVAMLYMSGVMAISKTAERAHIPKWIQPAIGGAVAGAMALWMPLILGLGDNVLQNVLEQDLEDPKFGLTMLLSLGLAKLVASAFSLGLRYPGGTFTPAMFLGAMLGGVCGMLIDSLDYQISVLVGMGAVVGAVIGAPLTVILIVFELTENYEAATAVMVAVVLANAVVTRYFARSLFHRQIRYWGIEIDRPAEQRILSRRQVGTLIRRHYTPIQADATIQELQEEQQKNPGRAIYVIDSRGDLVGEVPELNWNDIDGELPLKEFCQEPKVILEQDESLWSGFEKFEASDVDLAPVVESVDSRRLVGLARFPDFLAAYRRAVQEGRKQS